MKYKQHVIFALIFSLFVLGKGQAQNFSDTWNYKGHTFFYQLKSADKGQRLVIKTTQSHQNSDPTSHTVYSTSVFTKNENGKLKSIKILGSIQDGYIWSAMLDEYLRADFQGGKVNYTVKGEMMSKPESQAKMTENVRFETYSVQNSNKMLMNSMIHRFIAQYYPTFAVIGNPPKPKEKLTGEISALGTNYTFEIKADMYGKNKGVLKIRKKTGGLVFESMINLADKKSIKIHLAKPEGWAWAIYDSDYERVSFQGNSTTFERTGRVLTIGKPNQSTLSSSKGDNISRAVQHFIERYSEIFIH